MSGARTRSTGAFGPRDSRISMAAGVPRANVPPGHTVGVPRNDPTDTGGLFIGPRPVTAPVRDRPAPERGDERRRRVDAGLAAAVLVLEALLVLTAWGPQPVG